MIVDYSEYITEKASKGIVNSVYVENGLPLFKHDSICPFCKQKIENVIHHKSKTDYPEWLWGRFDQSELVVGVGRDYEFIDEEKESGGSGVMRSMPC